MRTVFILSGLLLIKATACFGQTPSVPLDTSGWGKPEKPVAGYRHALRQRPGFIGWSRGRALDSVRTVYIAYKGLQHEFGEFYRDTANRWYVLSTSFGEREGESRFILVPCPQMDKATFRNKFPYWRDRNGVYYARLAHFQQKVFALPEADPASFHPLEFERLAVDKKRVFQGGAVVPRLSPACLRVYTPNGERYGRPDTAGSDAYLLSGKVGYRPNGQPLTEAEALHFRPPAGYRLAYPLPSRK